MQEIRFLEAGSPQMYGPMNLRSNPSHCMQSAPNLNTPKQVTPIYFEVQHKIAALQGTHNIWIAGFYNQSTLTRIIVLLFLQ